jgi:peptidoglycan pentaglycine glycine transferase (the first glycine)
MRVKCKVEIGYGSLELGDSVVTANIAAAEPLQERFVSRDSNMQIRLCGNGETWNRVVLGLGGTLYHSWEWGAMREAEGWIPWRVLVESDGNPRAAVQILEKRLPMRAGCLLCAARGIAGDDDDGRVVKDVVSWMRSFARERKAILLRMDPAFPDTDQARKAILVANGLRSLPDQWSFWNLQRSNMAVDIQASEGEILRKMRPTNREYIKRSVRDGCLVEDECGIPQLREFYGLLLKSSQRQGFPVRPLDHFLHVREQLIADGRGRLLLARNGGRAVAGLICVRFGNSCYYLYGGLDRDAHQPHASEFLHWKAIQWAKSVGCTRYDLLGSGTSYPPEKGSQGYGLYHFKKGFGAELAYSAGYFDLVCNKSLYRAIRIAERNPGLIDAGIKLWSLLRGRGPRRLEPARA